MLKRKYKKIKKKTWWTRAVLRGSSLARYIFRKRKYLDLFLKRRRIKFLKILYMLMENVYTLWTFPGLNQIRYKQTIIKYYFQLHLLYLSFKKFMYLEKKTS